MITLRNITIRRGPNILLQDVNWTIYHKQRIGMIGANGSGKTTFFSMLLNELQADSGDLEIPHQLKIAHVAQETPAYSQSAIEFVLDGDTELRKLQHELEQAESANDGQRIATLHHHLSEIDAYTANARAAQLLDGLGFTHLEQQKPVSDFSGGWRVRLNLAKALMSHSDVLLLDEPTNHLDLDAVLWLEQWLKKYTGTLLLISHDRDFLDEVVNHIAHVHNKQLKLYAGNYSVFEKQRAADLLVQQVTYDKQQKHLAHLQSFVNRFRAKATKAAQAQSRLKAIEKMELVSAIQSESPFQFHFKKPKDCPNPLIHLENARIAYGDRVILDNLNFSITPKDRIALLGPNGAGKSSFIKLLAGELCLASGTYTTGSGLRIGYFAQHQVDHLQLHETPLFHLKKLAADTKELDLRTYLGSFGFIGNRVIDTVKNFSGGEKSRLALALLIWQQPNLLLLDEPTNHLDLEMRQALSLALQEYEGAMIIVSHDRFLVRTTVDQLVLVAEGKLKTFAGDLNDYQKWLLEFRRQQDNTLTETEKSASVSRKEQRQQNAQQRHQLRPLLQKIRKLEDSLTRLQQQATQLELALTDLSIYEDKNKATLQGLLLEQADLKKKIEAVESDWLEACDELEKAEDS
jgi:ATP-binding cassette subfamily F protein 3